MKPPTATTKTAKTSKLQNNHFYEMYQTTHFFLARKFQSALQKSTLFRCGY